MDVEQVYEINANGNYIKYLDEINASIKNKTRLDAPEP